MTLNMQVKYNKDGSIKSRGIEWTDCTCNPIAGCPHQCAWTMPDGKIANCYAEDIAHGIAKSAYPQGFGAHYWKPEHLLSPGKKKDPLRIFVGSMADVFAARVPSEHIDAVLQVARDCPQHTFQMLTKNPVRSKDFDMPFNVWLGASMPPDFMWNKPLYRNQQERMLRRSLQALADSNAVIKWMSFEPLSWDVSDIVADFPDVLDWAIIGAASRGKTYYAPAMASFLALQAVLDNQQVATFYKGNLQSLQLSVWREDFPEEQAHIQPVQLRMF